MSREWLLQCVVLYLPVIFTAVLLGCVREDSRNPAALLISLTWQAALIPLLDILCQWLGCWRYLATSWRMLGMPLSLHLGWVVWWGAMMPLLCELVARWMPRARACFLTVTVAFGLDLWLMPALSPVVQLSPDWILGEVIMCVVALVPGMALYQMVLTKTHPLCRGLMISFAFALLVLWILPVSTITRVPLLSEKRWIVFVLGLCFVLMPGVWAVFLFGTVGKGTPIPFDPPRDLVTSGIYRWIANPMQTSILLSMLWVAWFLSHHGLAIAAISTWTYSIGIARWSENIDLTQRFGDRWLEYRRKTPSWWPRRRI